MSLNLSWAEAILLLQNGSGKRMWIHQIPLQKFHHLFDLNAPFIGFFFQTQVHSFAIQS